MSQRHNTICLETRVNDSPLSAKLKLVSRTAQKHAIGRAHGELVGYTECRTNAGARIIRTVPPSGRFFRPGIESTPCLRCLVGTNQLVAALKQAARWLLPSHSRYEIPLPISSVEAFGFDPSWIRRNGQAKYISVNCVVVYCLTLLSHLLSIFFSQMKAFEIEI